MARDFEYVCAAFLTRFFVGVILLVAGVSKIIGGYLGFVDVLTGMLQNSWIPQVLISPWGYALPIIEIALGLLLVLGLFADKVLLAAGILFTIFAAGAFSANLGDVVTSSALYTLITACALYLHGYDDWRLWR